MSNMLYIPLRHLSSKVLNHLRRIASFRNPEFYSKQALRLSTYQTPRIISCADIDDEYLALPRGCEDPVITLLREKDVPCRIEDKSNHGKPISVQFNGVLRNNQQEAVNVLASNNNGVLSATTAFGKTVIAAALIAEKKVNTLILVHREQLLEQWKERLEEFLDIQEQMPDMPKRRGRKRQRSVIGMYGSGKDWRSGIVDIAMMQSIRKKGEIPEWIGEYGLVIVDECHHVPAVSFEEVLKKIHAVQAKMPFSGGS